MKRIFTYILPFLLLGALASCSDELFEGPIHKVPDDGHLTLRYVIPEMETVHTRGLKESDIDNLYLLVFNSAGNLVQAEDATSQVSGESGSFEITLKSGIRKDGNLTFLLVANTPANMDISYFAGVPGDADQPGLIGSEKNTITTVSTRLLQMPSHKSGTTDTYLGMSGSATLSDVLGFNPIPLYRSAARVSVNMGKLNGTELETEVIDGKTCYKRDEALPFNAYGTAAENSIFAGADRNNPKLGQSPSTVNVSESATVTDSSDKYIHATKNSSTGRAFVIVKAKYNNIDYYYRLDYLDNTGSPIDIKPNHWYQFIVKEVKGKGFATPREASANPISQKAGNISWTVYEYIPRVMNSVTDGTNYLSVSDEVVHVGNLTGTNTANEEFYVYIHNKDNSYSVPPFSAVNCSTDKSWMKVTACEEDDTAEDLGSSIPLEGHNPSTPGHLYKLTLQISNPSNTPPGSQTGNITVRWEGLTRTIPVLWDRSFDPSDIIKSAVLQVYNGSGTEQTAWKQDDYFRFLTGNYTENGEQKTDRPLVWGVEAEANNGYDRNDGFHFPVLYGENASSPWTYKYTVRFKNQKDNIYKWRFSLQTADGTPDITVVRDNTTITVKEDTSNYSISTDSEGNKIITCKSNNENGPLVELSFNSAAAGSKYGTGILLVEVAPQGTNDWTEIPMNIYHTGFFHKDSTTHAVASSMDNTRPYTYYEVVEMAGYCWLDRNLGAHSSELYIERSNGQPQYGTTEGRGGYYYIAKQENKAPVHYTDICPPGYQVPYSTDWTSVKLSSAFWTTDLGSYNTAYFVSGARYEDGTYKNVYFPKARFYDASAKAGDSLTGYYWSQTTATGFEKNEIGRWLRGFVIFGETSYFNNSRIDFGGNNHSGYAMNIRAVRSHTESTSVNNYSFFVRGATHVFAYTENESGRVPVTTWPGTPVANFSTADMEYMNYSYSGGVPSNELKLIFNFKAANGSVISVSKGAGNTALITRDVSPSNLTGWKASGDVAPNGGATISGGTPTATARATTDVKTPSTNENYYWIINRSDASKVYITKTKVDFPVSGVTYQIHGTIFNGEWDTSGSKMALEKESDSNVWKKQITTTRAGKFVIQALRDGEEYTAYKREGGDGAVTIGTEMQTSTGGGNYTLPAGTYTFSFNADTKKLTVYDGNQSTGTLYQIHGNFDSNGWKPRNMTLESGKWVLKDVVVNSPAANESYEFGIKKTTYENPAETNSWFGSDDSNNVKTVILGQEMTTSSGKNFKLPGNGTYTFTFDPSSNKLTVTGDIAYVYAVRGNCWDDVNGWHTKAMTLTDGEWVLSDVKCTQNNFFCIGEYFPNTDIQSDSNQNTVYNGTTSTVTLDSPMTLVNKQENLKIPSAGTYTFRFNPSTKQLTVTKSTEVREIWLVGKMTGTDGWVTDDAYKFTTTDGGVTYTLTHQMTAGELFKFYNGDWGEGNELVTDNKNCTNGTYSLTYQNGVNMALKDGGTVTFTISNIGSDFKSATLTISGCEETVTLSGHKFGVRGLLWNGSSWQTKMMSDPTGTGKWTLNDIYVEANKDFGIGEWLSDSDGYEDNNQQAWYEANSTGDQSVSSGYSKVLTDTKPNRKLKFTTAGVYSFEFDETTKTLTITSGTPNNTYTMYWKRSNYDKDWDTLFYYGDNTPTPSAVTQETIHGVVYNKVTFTSFNNQGSYIIKNEAWGGWSNNSYITNDIFVNASDFKNKYITIIIGDIDGNRRAVSFEGHP